MESSIAEFLMRQSACELLPTNRRKAQHAGATHIRRDSSAMLALWDPCKYRPDFCRLCTVFYNGCSIITAFTSRRTNLSPFTKGCRERDASM